MFTTVRDVAASAVGAWRVAARSAPRTVAAATVLGVFANAAPAVLTMLVARLTLARGVTTVVLLALACGLLQAAGRVASFLSSFHRLTLADSVTLGLRDLLQQAAAQRFDVGIFDSPKVVDELELLLRQEGGLATIVDDSLMCGMALAQLAVCLVIVGTVSPWLLLTAVAAGPQIAAFLYERRLLERLVRRHAPTTRHANRLNGLAVSPAAARELRVLNMQTALPDMYAREMSEVLRVMERGRLRIMAAQGLASLGLVASSTLVILVAFSQVINGHISPVTAVAALFVTMRLQAQLAAFGRALPSLAGARYHVHRLRRLQDAFRSAQTAPSNASRRRAGGIVLRGLRYRYPGAARDALCIDELELRPGEVVAIVGPNGAGKSTLAAVLLGLRAPTELDPTSILPDQSTVAAALQASARLELTLADVVSLSEPDTAMPRVRSVLRQAGLSALMPLLSPGAGVLGRQFGGRDLSAGEWQRVALARARYRRRPRLYVFDEPTSNIDPAGEERLFAEWLRARSPQTTVVVVTHRLGLLSRADRVVVMDEGRVISEGGWRQAARESPWLAGVVSAHRALLNRGHPHPAPAAATPAAATSAPPTRAAASAPLLR